MTQASSHQDAVVGLAHFVRTDQSTIIAAWKKRIGRLPTSTGASLARHAPRLLEWLASSLEERARADAASGDLPSDESFSAPRAIAELLLLTETIDQLKLSTVGAVDDAARDSLHSVIDTAIAHSLARDSDENDRVRKRLRLATDVTQVGSWELDPESGIVGADPRSRELFGMVDGDPGTVEALTSRLHEGDRDRVRDGIARTFDSGRPYLDDCRTVQPHDGGLRWIAIAADSHFGAHLPSPRLLGIVHDITDRKRSEEEHARVVEELSRAVHLSEMFVGILSHDLRNPLSAMLIGAQLLGRELMDENSVVIRSRILSSGARMARMIDQLLDFTRARLGGGIPLMRDDVDLAQVARDVVEEGKIANTGSVVQLTTEGNSAGKWDRDRVAQILSNLLSNALQHGQKAGTISVVIDGTLPDSVRVSVHNQGAIPADLLPIIFSPFRGTLHKRANPKGLGLGLYVARQIALAHGGELEVESTTIGTLFTLELPRAARVLLRSKKDFVNEEEQAAFERIAAPLTAVTAQLFGATPLHERVPLEYSDIVKHYGMLLDTALHRKAYRGQGDGLADALRMLAERLGDLGAGPREVTDVHGRALKNAVRGVTAAKTQALLSEGRLLALELMGNLASYYRRRSRGHARTTDVGRTES